MSAGERRVLVIHPGALGDVLQAVPALRAVGATARVAFCGQPRLGELLVGARVVAETLSFDGLGLQMLFTREPVSPSLADRLARFDEVVSWFGSRDDRYPARLRALVPACVVAPPVPDGEEPTPVWRHLLATVGSPAATAARAPLALAESWRERARRALEEKGLRPGKALLVVHPGAGGAWKMVPSEILAGAIAPLLAGGSVDLLVHEGPADREATERFAHLVGPPALRLIGPPLPLLAGVLSLGAAYLGGDSGVSHLAAAVGAPAVILFPRATRERWAPWSPTARSVVMEGERDVAAGKAAEALREILA